jgi:hypothetical protein
VYGSNLDAQELARAVANIWHQKPTGTGRVLSFRHYILSTLLDVTSVTFAPVTEDVQPARWIMLLIKLPSNPSRHRVAVWRQLSKAGALSVGQGVWAAPDVPAFTVGITRALELTDQAGGEAISLYASGVTTGDAARFEATFTSAREDEWTEFVADCGKYEVELDKEISNAKFTLAELEEEEQSLERLQRWHRDISARDVFGAPGAADAEQRLRHCTERFADYTERVFSALHVPDGSPGDVQ